MARKPARARHRAGLRVRRRQGRRRHDDGGGQRGDRAGASSSRTSVAVHRPARRQRRRGGVLRRRAALLDRRRAREHAPARRGVLPRPDRRARSRGVDLLASSDRVMVVAGRRPPDPDAARVRREALPPHRARRAPLGRRGARRARKRRRGSWSSRTRSSRPCAAPAAWPRRCGSATARTRSRVVVSRADRLAEIGHEDVERAVGSPVKHSFPSDYRRALAGAEQGHAGHAREPQRAGRLVHDVRARARRRREAGEGQETAGALQPVRRRARAPSEESRS